MEKERKRRPKTGPHPDRDDEPEPERRPPEAEPAHGAHGITQRTYEEAIDEAVDDVHG